MEKNEALFQSNMWPALPEPIYDSQCGFLFYSKEHLTTAQKQMARECWKLLKNAAGPDSWAAQMIEERFGPFDES